MYPGVAKHNRRRSKKGKNAESIDTDSTVSGSHDMYGRRVCLGFVCPVIINPPSLLHGISFYSYHLKDVRLFA